MKNKHNKFYLTILLVLIHCASFSQILSIDHTDNNIIGWSGYTEIDFDYNKSTKTDWELVNNTYLKFRWSQFAFIFMNEIDLNRAGNSDLSNDGYQHLRSIYDFNTNLSIEAFLQNQYDLVQNIKNRRLLGLGVKTQIRDSNYLGVSIFYEHENLIDNYLNTCYRLNVYNQLTLNLLNNIVLSSFLYLQPRINDISDLRFSFRTNISIPIFKQIFFSVTTLFSHDSSPAISIPKTNYQILNGLKYKF